MGKCICDRTGFGPTFCRMTWTIPFRSCPIYIDRAVIVVNKPPGVVCQLRDDKVVRDPIVVLEYNDGLTNVPLVPLRE